MRLPDGAFVTRKKPMDVSTITAPASSKEALLKWGKSFLVPYYLTVFAVLGAATVGFAVAIGLLILVVANFNVLGLIE